MTSRKTYPRNRKFGAVTEMYRAKEEREKQNAATQIDIIRRIWPAGWEKWYDASVPEDAKYMEIFEIVADKIAELLDEGETQAEEEHREAMDRLNGPNY